MGCVSANQYDKKQIVKTIIPAVPFSLGIPKLNYEPQPPAKPFVIKQKKAYLEQCTVLVINSSQTQEQVGSSACRQSFQNQQQASYDPKSSYQSGFISQQSEEYVILENAPDSQNRPQNNHNVKQISHPSKMTVSKIGQSTANLKIHNFKEKSPIVIEFIIKNACNFKQLNQLSLERCHINDDTFLQICQNFKNLIKINISFNPITQKAYQVFKNQQTQFKSLVLGYDPLPQNTTRSGIFSQLLCIQHFHYQTKVTSQDIFCLLNQTGNLKRIKLSSPNNDILQIFNEANIQLIQNYNKIQKIEIGNESSIQKQNLRYKIQHKYRHPEILNGTIGNTLSS